MAATFEWKLDTLKTNPDDDNYITEATAACFGTEGSIIKVETVTTTFSGNKASVGADFKSFESLTALNEEGVGDGEGIILGWITTAITNTKVAEIEKTVQDAIDKEKLT